MSTNELTLTPSESPSLSNKLTISPTQTLGAVRRPVNTTGWREWLFTVDHKKLGIMYGAVPLCSSLSVVSRRCSFVCS